MKAMANQNGYTYILALTVVMIMGIMLGMVGQSWKTIKQREQEKELIFRGSQIKEAIENWYNPKYISGGGTGSKTVMPLLDLKDLLGGNQQANRRPYLPQNYAVPLDDKNPKCAPDCARLKVYQDPMTGKEWTIIRGNIVNGISAISTGNQGGSIIGVSSKSDETTFKTDFKDTALENIGSAGDVTATGTLIAGATAPPAPGLENKITKYSQWQFIADLKNDHSKIYKAYHESW